jgi:hypothetical protein
MQLLSNDLLRIECPLNIKILKQKKLVGNARIGNEWNKNMEQLWNSELMCSSSTEKESDQKA